MSTVAVLQRRQRSRHGRDALEALKFIGSLVLEVVGATEIGRLATKGIKYLIKRQEARTTLLPSPSTLSLTVEGRADGARPERQVGGTACRRQRPVTGLVTSAVSYEDSGVVGCHCPVRRVIFSLFAFGLILCLCRDVAAFLDGCMELLDWTDAQRFLRISELRRAVLKAEGTLGRLRQRFDVSNVIIC